MAANKRRGKASKYIIYSEKGLLCDNQWKLYLDGHPIELLTELRRQLKEISSKLIEKFNYNSRYFGYCIGDDKDKVYIYVQKERLRIDLCIDRENEENLKSAGFNVKYVNNYQGRSGWLTGWRVPHNTKKINVVVKWLLKAFEGNL